MNQRMRKFFFVFLSSFGKHEDEKRMNKIPPFSSLAHGNGGGQTLHTHFFFFCFHFFITHTPYFILPLTKHVYDMSWPSNLVYHACHGRPLLVGGNLTCKSPLCPHALIGPHTLTYHILEFSHISPID